MSGPYDELHRIMHSRPGQGSKETAHSALRRIAVILDDDGLQDLEVIDAIVEVIEAWEQYRYPGGRSSNFKDKQVSA